MKQRTHSWIAVRAIALLEDEGKEKNLVKLLKPHARKASIGAWIPDMADAKRAGSAIDNHILKMAPMDKYNKRFVREKADLLTDIGPHRQMHGLLKKDTSLSKAWWKRAYKGDVDRPGKHLPNRAMGMSTMLRDLLIMGNPTLDKLIPGPVMFAKHMHPKTRTEDEAAAMYCFMLSHFVADCCMPLHCDARRIAGYSAGIHKELEAHWNKKVGTFFEKAKLLHPDPNLSERRDSNLVLKHAREVDASFNLSFKAAVPDLKKGHDVWLDMIKVCRASFAISNIIAPEKDYPFDNSVKTAQFDTIFGPTATVVLPDLDPVLMYDAVLNTAIVWKHIWKGVSKN